MLLCTTLVGLGQAALPDPSSVIRLDAAYWGLRLIAWIHSVLGAVAVVAFNPKNQKNRSCLPPTWTREELGKRSAIERFFGRVFLFFHLQRPPLTGWSEIASQVALTYAASVIVGLLLNRRVVLISFVRLKGSSLICGKEIPRCRECPQTQ